jgi:hypothetical protein
MKSRPASARGQPSAPLSAPPSPQQKAGDDAAQRRLRLRSQFSETVDALKRSRADLVPDGFIAEYVALDWLEWRGGAVRLTMTGSNIFKQLQVRPV